MSEVVPQNQKTNLKWRTFVSLCVLAILGQIYLLVDLDRWIESILPDERSKPVTSPIAALISTTQDVRYRSQDDLGWTQSEAGVSLSLGDRILTGYSGKAEIRFLEGLGLEIGPESMIEIAVVRDGPESGAVAIRLLRGTLKRSRTLQVPAPKILVGPSTLAPSASAEFTLSQPEGEPARLMVTEGDFSIRSRDQLTTLSASEWAVLQRGASQDKIEKRTLSLLPLWPAPSQVILSQQTDAEIEFRWKGAPDLRSQTEPLLLQISSDSFFTKMVTEQRLPAAPSPRPETRSSVRLKTRTPGTPYFWRVIGARSGVRSEVFPFELIDTTQSVAPIVRLSPQNPASETEALPPPPEIQEIDVRKARGIPRQKSNKKRGTWLNLFVSEAWADDSSASDQTELSFSWKTVPEAARYRVEIASDRGFKKILQSGSTQDPLYTWIVPSHVLSTNKFVYFRIASIRADGRQGGFSPPKKVPLPYNTPPEVYGANEDDGETPQEVVRASQHSLPPSLVTQADPIVLRHARIGILTGMGSRSQWGDSILRRTSSRNLAFRQSAFLQFDVGRKLNSLWLFDLFADFLGFKAPEESNLDFANSIRAFQGHVRAERQLGLFSLGGIVRVPFRFTKNGPQSLSTQHHLSVGPSARLLLSIDSGNFFIPKGFFLALAAPTSGLLYGGSGGVFAETSIEWAVPVSGRWSIDYSLDARASYEHWMQTFLASTFDLSVGVTLHLRWSL